MADGAQVNTDVVLAVAAHPDDVDIVAGGTVGRWIAEGAEFHYCVVTDGDAGSDDATSTASINSTKRRLEQHEAAEVLGARSVQFLGLPDGRLSPSLELRYELAQVVRRIRPSKVLTHAPLYNLNSIRFSHPDHLAVGQALLAAVFPDARNPHAFRGTALAELGSHAVTEVWMMGAPSPNRFVDITDYLATKIQAVRCHKSQMYDYGDVDQFFLEWGQELAVEAQFAAGRLAEAFYVMSTA